MLLEKIKIHPSLWQIRQDCHSVCNGGHHELETKLERMKDMNKAVSSVAKGMAAGVAVGAVTYMMTNSKRKRNKAIKKGAGKAIKAVGTIVDNVSTMMK